MFALQDLTHEIQYSPGDFTDAISEVLDDLDEEYFNITENENYNFYEFGEWNQFLDTYYSGIYIVNKTVTYNGNTEFYIPAPCLDLLSDGNDVM